MRKIIADIENYGMTRLKENKKYYTDYGCDLHNMLFNEDYYIIGTYQAKQEMGSNAFDIIGEIQEYEKDNFGEVNTDLSNSEKVLNMYAYIVGENWLNKSETLQDNWNNMLDENVINDIIGELE